VRYHRFIFLFFLIVLMTSTTFNVAQSQDSSRHEVIREPRIQAAICAPNCRSCRSCTSTIRGNHRGIQRMARGFFREHHIWMVDVFFREHIAFAMGLMTNEMTAVALQQVKMIGTFFDAKHQLETQRLFQTLMAEAHKDYQPSEGLCDIGTTARALIVSEKKSDLAHQTLANRIMERQLKTGDNLSEAAHSELYSRVDLFKKRFCHKGDNGNGLRNLCAGAQAPRATINKDVDYTRTIDSVLTLEVDFGQDSEIDIPLDAQGNPIDPTADEVSVFALMANLFAHETLPFIGRRVLANQEGIPRPAAYNYMNLRAVAAKRSVAQNSISAIISEKATGEKANGDTAIEYAPFVKSAIAELGVPADDIEFIVGTNPSYFAQMEVLTKKLYQNPVFYTELYDKPANVLRKRAAIRAVGLMQDRDYYKSLLRSEAVLAVLLESMLKDEHERVYDDLNNLSPDGEPINE